MGTTDRCNADFARFNFARRRQRRLASAWWADELLGCRMRDVALLRFVRDSFVPLLFLIYVDIVVELFFLNCACDVALTRHNDRICVKVYTSSYHYFNVKLSWAVRLRVAVEVSCFIQLFLWCVSGADTPFIHCIRTIRRANNLTIILYVVKLLAKL